MFLPQKNEDMMQMLRMHFSNAKLDQNAIAAQVSAKPESCCAADQTARFSMMVMPAHLNPQGFMHGGVTATMFDHTMGSLIKCCRSDGKFGPTVNLNISYHRPIRSGEKLHIQTRVISAGKTFINTEGKCWQDDEMRPCASATGIFYLEP